jgi:hypothetical protein
MVLLGYVFPPKSDVIRPAETLNNSRIGLFVPREGRKEAIMASINITVNGKGIDLEFRSGVFSNSAREAILEEATEVVISLSDKVVAIEANTAAWLSRHPAYYSTRNLVQVGIIGIGSGGWALEVSPNVWGRVDKVRDAFVVRNKVLVPLGVRTVTLPVGEWVEAYGDDPWSRPGSRELLVSEAREAWETFISQNPF